MRRADAARTATRFALVGCTNFVVSLTVFYLCFNYLPQPVRAAAPEGAIANAAAYLAGMINSFLLNRSWTFRASGNPSVQALRFTIVNLVSLSVGTFMMFRFVDVLGYPELAVWVPLTILVMTLNYLGYKYWAFGSQPTSSRSA